MIKEYLADRAHRIAAWCGKRSTLWLERGKLWADLEEWISGPDNWEEIRARRKADD